MDLLLDLRAKRGMTVVVVTHNPLIATSCDRVVRLLDGRVIDSVDVTAKADAEAMLERISRIAP
jgi:putative ABC transport system ATP-binding protein